MKKLLKRLALIGIIASGIGGIVSGSYPVIGVWLGVLGLVGTAYDHFANERKNQFVEQFLEAQNQLLARSGIGSPYTKIVKSKLIERGFFKHAIPYLRKALETNPYDVEALELYVYVMSVEFSFREWVKHGTYNPKDKDWLYIYKIAQRGSKKYPENHMFLDAMGILLDVANQHKEARKLFRRSSQLRTDPYWHILIATSYGLSGRPDLALTEIESAIKKGAHGWQIEYIHAASLRSLGHYDNALLHINAAIKGGGKLPLLLKLKEECLFAEGKLIASGCSKVQLAWSLLLLNTKRSFFLLLGAVGHALIMVLIFISKKSWHITLHIPVVRKYQKKHLSPLEPELTVADQMVRKGHFEQGAKLYNRCRAICHDDISVLMNLALCYAHTGNKEKAIEVIDDALKIDPRNETLLWNREQYSSGVELKGIIQIDDQGNFMKRLK